MKWNNLPADNTDFSNLNSFKRSTTSTFLTSYCKVYFFYTFIVVLCYQWHSLMYTVILLLHVSGCGPLSLNQIKSNLSSAEPRSKVEPNSRWITLHQVELGSADPVQLNSRGYTVDDADLSTMLGLRANYNDVTVTRNAYKTVQYRLAVFCSNLKFPWSYYTIFASTVALIKIHILCFNRYSLIILCPLSR